jgi:predicted DNA-binding protein (MmcQ/YjbR family)
MMSHARYNAFCRKLPATTHVVQWDGSHVWKVGDKVFVIGGWHSGRPAFTFKVNDIDWEVYAGRRCVPNHLNVINSD